jgi:RNA polymerase sigma factor (sigma-70 family)
MSSTDLKDQAGILPFRTVGHHTVMTAHGEAIERVYRDHGERLWRALLGYTGDPELARDAAAEAFAQALARNGELSSAADWVWVAAFRIARGLLKDRPHTEPASEHPAYELPETVVDVVRALALVSERQRIAILLHDYGDRPTSEVAAMLGISTATVYVHLSQGRKRLRGLLEDIDG